ncbi:MAG: ATP-binding domain-containing protein, partial [bacterium]|nr:ATP-binding domain-containing protein [bacterium]
HPYISAIPNALIYSQLLEDDPSASDDTSLANWYNSAWGHDHPVLLVDTGPVGAWVTSVARGARSSRLNFLSATICVDIAQQLLSDDRPAMQIGGDRHVFVVCPYRPHAQLLELLLREEGLTDDVLAGTAHSFQGSEADVVILDLVNDEPHWRVAMFMPDRDKDMRRLLNVALTRSRRRLIVVGDFDYIATQAKRAFIGSKLIPFLKERYLCVSALDIVPCGLAARAAKAQSAVLGGDVEPDADRIVVTQEHFYSVLHGDISRSKSRIVIYSAFIAAERLGQLEAPLRAAVERGIRTYVVTKAHSDRRKGEVSRYCMLERTLTDWGIVVIHKRGMHEKLIFCDDTVLWSGSLNPLSFRDTQEVMERRFSKAVVADYVRTLRLDDLVGEYDGGPPSCPYCGGEVVASEGRDQPFFWRCVEENCYTRSVDQPPLDGGMIVCSACGAAVDFGEWGDKPAWRCKDNRRHHQRVARTHIRLPKMRKIIPKSALRKLDKHFGISLVQTRQRPSDSQGQLFPLD